MWLHVKVSFENLYGCVNKFRCLFDYELSSTEITRTCKNTEHQSVQPAGDPATYIAIQQREKAKNNALAGVMTPAFTKIKGKKTKAVKVVSKKQKSGKMTTLNKGKLQQTKWKEKSNKPHAWTTIGAKCKPR